MSINNSFKGIRPHEPCTMVIFGITGDLTARKLIPALFNLYLQNLLPLEFRCVGVARKFKTDQEFKDEVYSALETFSRLKPNLYPEKWQEFSHKIFYHQTQFDEAEGYKKLAEKLDLFDAVTTSKANRLYYLSTPPSFFTQITKQLKNNRLIFELALNQPWSRLIIEKPFGHDLQSALSLQKDLRELLHESQIYRIDHYLGKDTVQNLLVFRFSNLIFESLWNHKYIDHVQITVAEDLGMGRRGAFFEEAGMLRDVIQNHMMQLLTLVAMEPPGSMQATDIRNEKVKVLKSIRPFSSTDLSSNVVRGQYKGGTIHNQPVEAYTLEKDVCSTSTVETYAAMKLHIDNWRWFNVPFYLRAGKRLAKRASQIAIVFKPVPSNLFRKEGTEIANNALIIRIQPDDGISLHINCKVPDLGLAIRPVALDFDFETLNHSPPEAYERLLCDCMLGDSTLFARDDEVLSSWELLSPILHAWKNQPFAEDEFYAAGSWGPLKSEALIQQQGHHWHEL
jgi:glucose-6-phosphate 1-dehydrogenase